MDDGLYSIQFKHFTFGVNHTSGDNFVILTDDANDMYYVVRHARNHDHPGKWEILAKRPYNALLAHPTKGPDPITMDDQWRDFPEDKTKRMFLADQRRLDRLYDEAQSHRPRN